MIIEQRAFIVKQRIHVKITHFFVFRVIRVHAQETNTYARVNLYEMSTNKSC